MLALRTYRNAVRQQQAPLRVHTAALGACLLDTPLDTRRADLETALSIYSHVQAAGMPLDTRFFGGLVAVAGRARDLPRVLAILDDMATAGITPCGETAAAAVTACLACGDRTEAARAYRAFLDSAGPPPAARAFTALIAAHGAAGELPGAVRVLEELAAAGLRPTAPTVAALAGACQRAKRHELAFAVGNAARSCGVPLNGAIGFVLIRTAFNKIRLLWAPPDGYPIAVPPPGTASDGGAAPAAASEEEEDEGDSDEDAELSERLLRALSGRPGQRVKGDGAPVVAAWRDRAHVVYRELVATGVPIVPALRERLIGCMMLSKSQAETASSGGEGDLAAVAALDGRFDARAYTYIQVRPPPPGAAGHVDFVAVVHSWRSADGCYGSGP